MTAVPPQTACRPAVGSEPPRAERRSNRGEVGRPEGARAASPPFEPNLPAKRLVPSDARVGIHEPPWRARPMPSLCTSVIAATGTGAREARFAGGQGSAAERAQAYGGIGPPTAGRGSVTLRG